MNMHTRTHTRTNANTHSCTHARAQTRTLRRELDLQLTTEVHAHSVTLFSACVAMLQFVTAGRSGCAYCFSKVSFSPTYDAIILLIWQTMRRHKLKTPHPKPQTQNPNPKPQPPTPKPQTPNPNLSRLQHEPQAEVVDAGVVGHGSHVLGAGGA